MPWRYVSEAMEAWIRFLYRFEVARVEVVMPAVEVEPDAVIENRPPAGQVELALDEPREPVIGRPAVEEVAVGVCPWLQVVRNRAG
jgi:hypothetical protein